MFYSLPELKLIVFIIIIFISNEFNRMLNMSLLSLFYTLNFLKFSFLYKSGIIIRHVFVLMRKTECKKRIPNFVFH